jgi:hypothetical protein
MQLKLNSHYKWNTSIVRNMFLSDQSCEHRCLSLFISLMLMMPLKIPYKVSDTIIKNKILITHLQYSDQVCYVSYNGLFWRNNHKETKRADRSEALER